MKTLYLELKSSVLLIFVFATLLCGAYPLVVWAGAQLLFPSQANGSLLADKEGAVRGSRLLAQNFSSEKYFQPRPSAAGSGYDATASSGTNLGPTSQKLSDRIKAAVISYRQTNGLSSNASVPADAVTSSGSGLDPHISEANAQLQASRVAKARGLSLAMVNGMIASSTEGRDWKIFGEPRVNVLLLNVALDELSPAK